MQISVDVLVVGAGFGGTALALSLLDKGARVMLTDQRRDYPSTFFRAEKIEASQAARMRRLGLFELRRPLATPVEAIETWIDGETETITPKEQYGLDYAEAVNAFRDRFAARAQTEDRAMFRIAKLEALDLGADGWRLARLSDGGQVRARLVVLAGGMLSRSHSDLHLRNFALPDLRSMTFGFDLALKDGAQARRGHHLEDRAVAAAAALDYVTYFPLGDRLRVNVFTRWRPEDPRCARMRAQPLETLSQLLPDGTATLPPHMLASPVYACPTTFSRLQNPGRQGVVILGDQYQTVSPTTGMGLDKVLTDVELLAGRYAPDWLERFPAGAPAHAVARFYRDEEKRRTDDEALSVWRFYRDRSKPKNARRSAQLRDKVKLAAYSSAAMISDTALETFMFTRALFGL